MNSTLNQRPRRSSIRWAAPIALLSVLFIGSQCDRNDQTTDPTPTGAEGSANPVLETFRGVGEGSGDSSDSNIEVGVGEGAAEPTTPPISEKPTAVDFLALLESLQLDLTEAVLDDTLGRLVIDLDSGDRLVLTLDPNLQSHMTQVVHRYDEPAEALVAIEPATGRVLAWIEDSSSLSPTQHPASSAEPYAASVFKIISTAALIQEVNLGLGRNMCVPPGHRGIEEEDLVSNADRDTRCVDLIEANANSVNVYFARLTNDHLTVEMMDSWVERFAFNTEIPFEIEVEPSRVAVPRDRLERARMAAGFRHAHLSPFHAALIAAATANDGTLMRPTIVAQIIDSQGEIIYEHQPAVWREVMQPATAQTLTRSLSQTTISGTARRYFADREGWPEDLLVAGKTGTLTNRGEDGTEADPSLTYSWFVGFAPIDAPEVAVAGLVYNTERWHIKGSYLASEAIIRLLHR